MIYKHIDHMIYKRIDQYDLQAHQYDVQAHGPPWFTSTLTKPTPSYGVAEVSRID